MSVNRLWFHCAMSYSERPDNVGFIYNFISPYGSTKIKKNNTNTTSNDQKKNLKNADM